MGLFSRFFNKKNDEAATPAASHTEEFMTLIRVYYQSVIATQMGITNLNMLPDMALFKRMLKIPTQGGKLGVAEKARARKVLMQNYKLNEEFFKEVDRSIKKNCKTVQDINSYFYKFQGFNNDLFVLIEKMMNIRFRLSLLFNKLLYKMTSKTIHKILTRSEWTDISIQKAAWSIRKYQEALGYSEQWIIDFVYQVLLLAKKDNTGKRKS
ncbi:MAG: hypothetical protein PHG27_03155 [Massilibacteroides sp.]|nr:hypothetical protein [Massilibacteroides sp.]MDD3064162.1 hypothetical protein [Massilibacteroides sp.]MDD4114586.1 hypothetical protein [Massilibacteroides sp.]MDD4660784.1 hypothetical protein [Massilibacteroides sp.]